MGIISSQFNWVSTPSGYSQVTNWRAKQKAFNSNVASNLAAFSDTLTSASSSYGYGMSQIAAQKAAARVMEATQAKITQSKVDMKA
ncbi:hypothetical protein CCR97_25060 [Rhodoplanes elegans]|uniref:Uncharacterized protein n=1 Tax=Rhodoplanes elegans TaxID=29408 RepID=A0A327KK18_9BRAD|nr:hypothetical protein [Rhodoplanes elegans]MBK5961449.1 hypothetical protein [Rhodoplanes elegans]RAI37682.1 hypothetical protein CH338_15320 [Rhodoplanes elegans]